MAGSEFQFLRGLFAKGDTYRQLKDGASPGGFAEFLEDCEEPIEDPRCCAPYGPMRGLDSPRIHGSPHVSVLLGKKGSRIQAFHLEKYGPLHFLVRLEGQGGLELQDKGHHRVIGEGEFLVHAPQDLGPFSRDPELLMKFPHSGCEEVLVPRRTPSSRECYLSWMDPQGLAPLYEDQFEDSLVENQGHCHCSLHEPEKRAPIGLSSPEIQFQLPQDPWMREDPSGHWKTSWFHVVG